MDLTGNLAERKSEKPQKFKSRQQLAEYLGFATVDELDTWLSGRCFRPLWDESYKECIGPLRAEAARTGRRPRMSGFERVQMAERAGQTRNKYGTRYPAKATFTTLDWYCYLMFNLRLDNCNEMNGLFWRAKNMDEHQMNCRLWSLIQFMLWDSTASRAARKRNAGKQAAQLGSKRQKTTPAPQLLPQQSSVQQPSAQQPSAQQSSAQQLSSSANESETEPENDEGLFDEGDDEVEWLAPVSDQPAGPEELELIVRTIGDADPKVLSIAKQVAASQAGLDVSAMQMMQLEATEHLDLSCRYWQHDVIKRLITAYTDTLTISEQTRILSENFENLSFEEVQWRDATLQNTDDSESLPMLPFAVADEADKDLFTATQKLLDNDRFQPQGLEAACNKLGFENHEIPRYPCMPTGVSFLRHQVTGMAKLRQFKDFGLRGALVCDQMGLGKTIESVGTLLTELQERMRKIAAREAVSMALPSIYITYPYLLHQAVKDIEKLCPDLKVLIYHGDYKEHFDSPIQSVLTKDHKLFNGEEKNAWTIIVTTPGVCAQRHGPSPQTAWRMEKLRKSKDACMKIHWQADESWPQNLSGLFHYCIVDEAQSIKNPATYAHTAIRWFNPHFTILVTGTPDINNLVADCEGYMHFVQPPQDVINRAMEVDNLRNWGITAYTNVYDDVEDDHPAAQTLRPTLLSYKKWITNKDAAPNATVQGLRMAACLQSCMIRRSMISKVDGKEIGLDVPMCKRRRAVCPFTKDEKMLYDDFSAAPKKKLIRLDRQTGNITWNWSSARLLILLTTWTGFYRIHNLFTADKVPDLLRKRNLLEWIVRQYCKANPEEVFPEDNVVSQIALILKGSPKLRAMLSTISEVTIKYQLKMLIFTTIPAELVLITAILWALEISARPWHAGLSGRERSELQAAFNETETPMIIVGSYSTMSTGLNFQHRCHWTLYLNPPPSHRHGEQADGRTFRIGQEEICEFVTFSVPHTFNDKQVLNNLRKAIPSIITNLNNKIFGPPADMSATNEEEEVELTIGEWVQFQGRLYPATDAHLPAGLPVLKGQAIIDQILNNTMGIPFQWPADDDEDDE